jgi:methionyl-tRNA synthetase
MNAYYVTTAIDYPNGKPHIGHAFEKIVSDIFARWNRLKGKKVFFSTGTDEHGQKLEKYSKDANKTPKEYVDETVRVFQYLCELLNISNDVFIRTTDSKHEDLSREIFDKVLAKGDIYLGKYSGNYCIYDERFFTEKDLVEGKLCPECGRETTSLSEDAYFFKLGKYQKQIIEYIEKEDFIRPLTRKNEILSRLKGEKLRDLCVSRTSFKWGIPLKNDSNHVIYVWFDALINYLSAIDYPNGVNKNFWPANVHVIGKDIIWFHTVIWPAMLLAAEISLPKKVYAHGFILSAAGDKMSKSKGNIIDPVVLAEKYGSDPLRYYLAKVIPSADDGYFSEQELVQKYNTELGNDFGNLVMRCVKLSIKNFGNKLEKPKDYQNSSELLELQKTIFQKADTYIANFEYDSALDEIWQYVKKINSYLNETEPWKIKDSEKLKVVLYTALDNFSNVSVLLKPFIPETIEKIEKQIGIDLDSFDVFSKEKTFVLTDAPALFPRIDFVEEKFMPELRVAEIISATEHPDAESLLVLKINLGKEERQLVAGLRKFYSPADLIGKKIAIVANLQPAKLRGIESQGMLLAGVLKDNDSEKVKILEAKNSVPGDLIKAGSRNYQKEMISYEDFKKFKLKISRNNVLLEEDVLKTDSEKIFVDLEDGKVY